MVSNRHSSCFVVLLSFVAWVKPRLAALLFVILPAFKQTIAEEFFLIEGVTHRPELKAYSANHSLLTSHNEAMLQRLLVIFEDEKVSPEALTYARELARRMDSEVTLLMLIEMHFQGRTFLDSKRETFRNLKKRINKTMTQICR